MSKTDGAKPPELFRLFRGTSIILAGKVIGGGLSFAKSIILARVLGAAGYGLFALAGTAYDMGASISGLGFNSGLTKFVPMYKATGNNDKVAGTLRHVVYCVIATGVVVGAVILIFAGKIAARYHKPGLAPLLDVLAVGIPTASLLLVYTTFTRSLHSMRASAVVQNIHVPLAFIGVFACFYFTGRGIMAAAVALVIADAVGGLLCIKYLLRLEPGVRNPASLDKAAKKEFHKYSGTVFSVNVAHTVNAYYDMVLLGACVSSAQIGVYSAAVKVTYLMSVAMNALNMVFPQMVSERFAGGDMENIRGLYRTVTRWLIYLCFPAALFLSLFSKDVLGLAFGEQYTSGGSLIVVLAIGYTVNYTLGHSANFMLMMDKQKLYAINQFFVSVVTVALGLVLIPSYGIMGAAVTRSVSLVIANLLMVVQLYIAFGFQPFDRACLTPVFISVLTFLPAYLFDRAFNMFWVPATISVVAFAVLSYYFGIRRDDKELLAGLKEKIMAGAGAKNLSAP